MAKGKAASFLTKDTAGLPNWAWVAVVGVGLAAAYVIPKFFGQKSSSDTSNLGAIDPNTGLPYSFESSVPGNNNCLPPTLPTCGANQYVTANMDTNGCLTLTCADTPAGSSKCKAPTIPVCKAGQHLKASLDANKCLVLACVADTKCPPPGPPLKCPVGCHSGYSLPDANGCTHRECHKDNPGGLKEPCPGATAAGTEPAGAKTLTAAGGQFPQVAVAQAWPGTNTIAARRGITNSRLTTLNPQITEPNELQPGQIIRTS